jgi:hypothetical protein
MAEGVGVEDAVRVMKAQPMRTYGCNFVFADRGDGRGGRPAGVAIESTARMFAEFRDNDPREDRALWNGQNYNVTIPEAVFRGDCALDPAIRAKNLYSNGPDGDPRTANAYKRRYKGQSDRILAFERAGVLMGQAEAEQISRECAMVKSSLQCVVMNNTDLQIWVANSRIDGPTTVHQAFREPYHHYDVDYYMPTVRLKTGSGTSFASGTSIPCTLEKGNLGSSRRLDLHFSLEVQGRRYGLATYNARSFPQGPDRTISLTVPLKAGIPTGEARLIVEMMDAGTADLVDRDTVAIRTR